MLKKVLIVDDEPAIRELFRKSLLREGLGVVTAQSALDANRILNKCRVDCVVLDMKMPQVPGCAIYEVIRLFHKGTKVIVSSAYDIAEQRQVMAAANGYFDKSEGIHRLVQLIRQVLFGEKATKEEEWNAVEDSAAYQNGNEIGRTNEWICN